MKISHKIINVSGEDIIYIYVNVEDIYEFSKENLGKGENTDFLTKLRAYISNNVEELKKGAAIIVINGVVIGALTLSALYTNKQKHIPSTNSTHQVQIYSETVKLEKQDEVKEEIKEKNNNKHDEEKVVEKQEKKEENSETNKQNTNAVKKPQTQKIEATTTKPNKTNNTSNKKPTQNVQKTDEKKENSNTETSKPSTEQTSATKPSQNTETTLTGGRTIRFNNNGVISNIDLEEYVIGVVAAEMPASFHSEALKAQAVVARTYAMKKASKGITLVNSTSHQVYNSKEQMKAKWGSSYSTYYNKIKNAVNATKGKVLKYNGGYIEALYFSMSNGKTELPTYVWNTNYPYLQVVSSSWDENISAAKYTVTMTYTKLSNKLGIDVNEDSEIKVISKTAGNRVNEITIAGKTFTGVKIRSLLGLRSADFEITKINNGVSITTRGFGHGVGMSQYGANGAAKAGYTYKQILSHYYNGTTLASI